MKKIIMKAVEHSMVCVALAMGIWGCFTFAQAKSKTVKVAYFNMGDYYTEGTKGNIVSYDTDVLKMVSKYSDLKFEYVDCGTWSNALIMLQKHKVDLVGTAQWNDEREKEYAFCLESYGYTVGELATLKSKKIVYEDYSAIGKATIGCTYNYVRMGEMTKKFEDNHINPVIKKYNTQEELENALASGEIDIIAANSHTMKDEWNIVEKFSYSPYFFISWKGNESVVDEIDRAMIQIQVKEPDADDKLMKKYFPNLLGEPLSEKELKLIEEDKTYTIYYSTDIKPLSWYDEESDTMKGALVDACKQVTQNTGLKISVRPDWEQSGDKKSTPLSLPPCLKIPMKILVEKVE